MTSCSREQHEYAAPGWRGGLCTKVGVSAHPERIRRQRRNEARGGGLVYPLLNPCHNVVGKTSLVMIAVQGAPVKVSFSCGSW